MKSFLPATIIAHSGTILLTNCLQPYSFIWEVSKSRQSGWWIKHLCMVTLSLVQKLETAEMYMLISLNTT